MHGIEAIPTYYKEYLFRSRLEVRWAMLFDALSLSWKYEYKTFDCGDEWYLPDFFLPEISAWVEIKPYEPSKIESDKIQSVSNESSQIAFLFSGFPVLQSNGEKDLELSEASLYMFLPNEPYGFKFEVKELFHLLKDMKSKNLLIKAIFNITQVRHEHYNLKPINEILTKLFVKANILNKSMTQYAWHDHLNKNELKPTHSVILNLPEQTLKGLSELKDVMLEHSDKENIESLIRSIRNNEI